MTTPQVPASGVDPSRGVGAVQGGAARSSSPGVSQADGAAFRALLDQLEGRAGALAERSKSNLDAADLPAAVDEARASLDDALQLSKDLLEAWRQSRHQAGTQGL
jgi:hypothetical protein